MFVQLTRLTVDFFVQDLKHCFHKGVLQLHQTFGMEDEKMVRYQNDFNFLSSKFAFE
jgi:hypothetical protein